MGMGNYLIPDYPEADDPWGDEQDSDESCWWHQQDLEQQRLEQERARADAQLDAERDLELLRQAGAL